MKTYSLRTSTLLNFILPLVLTVIVMMVASLLASYHEVSALNDAQMEQLANTLHILTRHEALEGDDISQTLGSQAEQIKPLSASMVAYRVWSDNRLVTESPNAASLGPHPGPPGFSLIAHDGTRWRAYVLHDAARRIDIEVAQDHAVRWMFLRDISSSFLIPLMALIPALLLIIMVGIGRAMAPLTQLSKALDERDTQNLAPVHVERVPVEILPIYDALNNLFARVNDGLQREREFTDNAAHELRTPLAALKVRAQVMAQDIKPRSPLRASMDELLVIIERSSKLVDQMLTAARLHESNRKGVAVDVSDVVNQQVAAFRDAAAAKAQGLAADVMPNLRVVADEAALNILVRNLLDNAIRYTPANGKISLALKRMGGSVVLCIADSGPGIRPVDYQRALERFTRFSITETGSGLGLSIVNWICKRHGATLAFRANTPSGLVVEITFPAPPK